MGKKSKKSKKSNKAAKSEPATSAEGPVESSESPSSAPKGDVAESVKGKMKRKAYEAEMRVLQGELVAMQEWVKTTGAKDLCRVRGPGLRGQGRHHQADHRTYEPAGVQAHRPAGADRAREVADVRPALHRPLPRGRGGRDLRPQLVQPRRCRAGVGLLHARADRAYFLDMVPAVEKAMVDSGIILVKYWLNVSVEEQARRLESRIDDPRKIWKLSPTDLKSFSRRYDYCRARDAMLAATDTSWAPWFVANNDDKKRGRLNIISHLLGQIPYEPVPRPEVKLPKQPSAQGLRRARAAAAPRPREVLRAGTR